MYTVLGFPWPGSSSPGATEFDSAVPGVGAYQALVSYAGVEMALQVARSAGRVDVGTIESGTWRSSLYDYQGLVNQQEQLVEEGADGWVSAG